MAGPKPTADVSDATPIPGALRAAVDSGPLVLDAIAATGAVWSGRPVKLAVLVFEDGEKARLPLPLVPADSLNTAKDRIMAALKKSPKPMSRKEVARQLRFTSTRGRFGDAFRALVIAGKVLRAGDEYTDDPAKIKPLSEGGVR